MEMGLSREWEWEWDYLGNINGNRIISGMGMGMGVSREWEWEWDYVGNVDGNIVVIVVGDVYGDGMYVRFCFGIVGSQGGASGVIE